ncbi:alpha,alpha-trehalose-phosphate synthase [UDP-forming] 1 [Cryptococcus wingfieldii CBS 7118]|uniref:alpha,alpha-trehalose-phosphate synthase (UDP-forming) n=1 Tax=Cryptococcus wingfieldii CBS 7118 TaxID=1295528 RepID=A0A1E3HYP6_9TREE|nr:alpha,alpha-trehalose-phosphate synthase [UDP-forming] 1 [Cryptococcus wingfieldii CBS 7118]ODN81295.1 alpha,alpha-trehalose-phosphate synthase [UDP-forming] 1 [Cryptococcus wingfieldii CBS 7118]
MPNNQVPNSPTSTSFSGTFSPGATAANTAANANAKDSSPSTPESPVMGQRADGKEQRLIVVSNRLPVTISKDANGEYHFKMSSGGLVSALSGCKKSMSFIWIGWPGKDIPMADREHVNQRLLEEYNCLAVYLSDELADRHYNGFSNSILWPLFHYHPGEMNFDAENWLAYREANMRFADTVSSMVQAGDMVWVQDYHLMLLPMLLRSMITGESAQGEMVRQELGRVKEGVDDSVVKEVLKMDPGVSEGVADEGVELLDDVEEEGGEATHAHGKPHFSRDMSTFQKQEAVAKENGKEGVRIGFFLHTPFPSSEIYRILPVRREILLGVLQCDLIGFHTYDYARHFLSSCTRILGLETQPNGIEFEGRYCQVGTFPIGIDPHQFTEGIQKESIRNRIRQMEARFEGCKVILGVDRLDYIKGIPQKLHALEVFLTQHPEWIGKVVLVQLAIPSRQDVEEYQNLRACVNELVGRINGRFGTVESMPIHFMHKSVPFEELTAMYALSDACLVTSTRDGMNLVAYEYISSQAERNGSMILSEFAGAAQSLNGSILINPWDVQSTADAIHQSLTMGPEQRSSNWQKLYNYVSKYTAEAWGVAFVKELTRLSGQRPSGPAVPAGRRRSNGSSSRTSSKASTKRRSVASGVQSSGLV